MLNNKKYLVCNLKAFKNKEENLNYEINLNQIKINSNIELIICPSTPFLYIYQNYYYKLGSQDISKYEKGAHTGENTAEQLASLNVKYALIGHSARRKLIKEEESTIIEKIKKAYHNDIKPIYFVGETEDQKKYKVTKSVLEKQLIHIIDEVPGYKREKIIIVYEPIWAIGSGITPTAKEIMESIKYIKDIVSDNYNLNLSILYGGSVNETNIEELIKIECIDGFVLGESTKNIETLIEICNKF